MLEFLSSDSKNAINILKSDHQTVKDLFDRFERVEERKEKKQIVMQAIEELKMHAAIEEEIFYPALRKAHEEKDIMNEADEEHHVAKLLIAELSSMSGSEPHYDAKFKVLAESVRHHIREEESKMMPKARALEIDFEALGDLLLARKDQLKQTGVPESEEDRMVAKSRMKNSPAKSAVAGKTSRLRKGSSAKAKPESRSRGKVIAMKPHSNKDGGHKAAGRS